MLYPKIGQIIKGYAIAYGKVQGVVISDLEAGDYRVTVTKPKKFKGHTPWVNRVDAILETPYDRLVRLEGERE